MTGLITLEHVVKQFGSAKVLDDLNIVVPEGTIFGLFGQSGSGKTTAIRVMIGIYAPTSGRVITMGMPPTRWPAKVREQVGYMPQIPFLYPNLSVAENLNFSASVYGLGWLRRRKRLKSLLEMVELQDDRGKLVSQLSGGMRKRLSLACALVRDPKLVILDEPTAGIDPILRQHFWTRFRQLRDDGNTLLVTSHYVGEAEYCDIVAVIGEGRVIATGTPGELRRQALGGEAVDVVTAGLCLEALQVAREISAIRDAFAMSKTAMRLLVDDAGTAVPLIAEALGNRGVPVEAIREYRPPFDEVFAKLVQEAEL